MATSAPAAIAWLKADHRKVELMAEFKADGVPVQRTHTMKGASVDGLRHEEGVGSADRGNATARVKSVGSRARAWSLDP